MKAIKGDIYKILMTAVFEKPKYWSNGKAVYEFMKHKYPDEVKIVEENGCSCKEDDSAIMEFIGLIETELINNKKNE